MSVICGGERARVRYQARQTRRDVQCAHVCVGAGGGDEVGGVGAGGGGVWGGGEGGGGRAGGEVGAIRLAT